MTTALVDMDIVAFRTAAASEAEPVDIAILRADKLMRDILEATQASRYLGFLTGSNNFRKEINPDYKANRKDKPLPIHLNDIREYLVTEWKISVTDGYEADDALGFHQTDTTVICSIDKDLLQIPGRHYNFVKQEFIEVTELDGLRHFWKQMLIGDVSDNIKGVDGIGPKKAAKLIDPLETNTEMFWTVSNLYDSSERFWMNCDCLWIWRNEHECFSELCQNFDLSLNLKSLNGLNDETLNTTMNHAN